MANANESVVRVVGIPELQRALRQIDRELPRELAAGLAEAAGIVLTEAKRHVPERSGDAIGSMKVKKQQRAAALAVGGSAAPYYPWLDFGGTVGRGHLSRGEGASRRGIGGGTTRRPFIKSGRYIYPALSRKNDEVKAKVDEVLERLARHAGFDTKGRSDK